jgi:hypothetical protein
MKVSVAAAGLVLAALAGAAAAGAPATAPPYPPNPPIKLPPRNPEYGNPIRHLPRGPGR